MCISTKKFNDLKYGYCDNFNYLNKFNYSAEVKFNDLKNSLHQKKYP